MNYYPFHLGDYAAHTAHLEPMEDLAYRRMLDAYYLREGPLPASSADVARLIRMRQHMTEIESVLQEFFQLTEDGWVHARCAAELAKMQDKQAKARASAAASVAARSARHPNGRSTNAQRTLNERSTDVELPTPTPTPTPKEKTVPSAENKPGCTGERALLPAGGFDEPETQGPPSTAVAVCTALRSMRISGINPSDPRLTAAIAEGVELAEFIAAGQEAASKGKGAAWVVATAVGRHRDALAAASAPPQARASPQSAKEARRERDAEWLAAVTGKNRRSSDVVIDV